MAKHRGRTASAPRQLIPGELACQGFAEEEHQCVKGLLLGGDADSTFDGELREKIPDVIAGGVLRALFADELVKPPGPFAVGLLGAPGIMIELEALDQAAIW